MVTLGLVGDGEEKK